MTLPPPLPQSVAPRRSRAPLVLVGVIAAVIGIALAVVGLTQRGDDKGRATDTTEAPATDGTEPSDGAGSALADGYGVVVVDGDPLRPGEGTGDPDAIAPTLHGTNYDGQDMSITPGEDGPLMVVFLAHWCPHCNAEVPVLLDWEQAGGVPDDLTVVGVSTAVTNERPNFPPDQWLDDKGWDWPAMADDAEGTAAQAFGVTGYPFIVFIDADGRVVGRISGEQPIETIEALAAAAVGD